MFKYNISFVIGTIFCLLSSSLNAQSMLMLGAGKENPAFTGQVGTVEVSGIGNLTQLTGTYGSGALGVTATTTTGLVAGMFVNSDAATSGLTPTVEDTITIISSGTAFTFAPTATTGAQTTQRINISDIKGTLTNGSPIVTDVVVRNGANWIYPYGFAPGMRVYGNGIPTNSTILSVSGSGAVQSVPIGTLGPTSALTATWNTLSLTINTVSPNSNSILSTMFVTGCTQNSNPIGGANTSCGLFPSGDTINTIPSSSTFTLLSATKPSTAETAKAIYVSSVKASGLSGNNSLTNVTFASGGSIKNCSGATPTIADIVPGMLINGPGIVPITTVTAASGTTITLSQNASTGATTAAYMLTNNGGNITNNSATITCVSMSAVPAIGSPITGTGIPINTTVTGVTGNLANFAAGSGTLTISNLATATSNIALDLNGSNSITISANATRTGDAAILLETGFGSVTAGSTTVSSVSFPVVPTVGGLISIPGTGLPGGTTIATAPSSLASYQAGTGTITLSVAPPLGGGPTVRFLLTR